MSFAMRVVILALAVGVLVSPGVGWAQDDERAPALISCCVDADGDGYHAGACTDQTACASGSIAETSNNGGDCMPSDPAVHPNASEVCANSTDDDCDSATPDIFDADGDNSDCDVDCDDGDNSRSPAFAEECDNANDDDCDSATPDIFDADGDGYNCNADCDDSNPLRSPGRVEVCGNSIDDDCEPTTPDLFDSDGDGSDCSEDCDDSNAGRSPDLEEACNNSIDDDCDPTTPDIVDSDGDGYNCSQDCDDSSAARSPGLVEVCANSIDDDCDSATLDIFDADGDGSSCDVDCDDQDANAFPGGPEVCNNSLDDDCNPATPDIFDADGDGSYCDADCDDSDPNNAPGNDERCDGYDNNCNGVVHVSEQDLDGDGYLVCGSFVDRSTADDFAGGGDCLEDTGNTYSWHVNPGRVGPDDACDGYDTDCHAGLPADEQDDDADGYFACDVDVAATWYLDWQAPVGITGGGDCFDESGTYSDQVHPNTVEICDGHDTNCNGVTPTDELDDDGDDWFECVMALPDAEWAPPPGQLDLLGGGDCLDVPLSDNSYSGQVNPGAISELCDGYDTDCLDGPGLDEVDGDGDGFVQCPVVADSGFSGDDCDDDYAWRHPATTEHPSPEVCDGYDNDCVDDSATQELANDEVDDDGDGYLPCASIGSFLDRSPTDHWVGGGDCLDELADYSDQVHPGAVEACDGYDTDCSTSGFPPSDEIDNDADGYLPCAGFVAETSAAAIGGDDCLDDPDPTWGDPYAPAVNPGVDDVCDGYDTDCSEGIAGGAVPEAADELDQDGDLWIECQVLPEVTDPAGLWIDNAQLLMGGDDCYDVPAGTNPYADLVNPGADEVCDGFDTDCSSGGTSPVSEQDLDGDGYVDCTDYADCEVVAEASGFLPAGLIAGCDCNPGDEDIHPNTPEVCDGEDSNCDGVELPTGETDQDADGVYPCNYDCDDTDPTVNPTHPEICDGKDNDCDGLTLPQGETDLDEDGFLNCLGDCNDLSVAQQPGVPDPDEPGVDIDCDGWLSVHQLDCDGDRQYPGGWQEEGTGCEPDDSPMPLLCYGVELEAYCRLELTENEDGCLDGLDNDGDGLADADDPDCVDEEVPEEPPEIGLECADGEDNDGDGLVDCADSDDCGMFCTDSGENCIDGQDNDGDGAVDCGDSECGELCGLRSTADWCSDGVDGDQDGYLDCDPETPIHVCANACLGRDVSDGMWEVDIRPFNVDAVNDVTEGVYFVRHQRYHPVDAPACPEGIDYEDCDDSCSLRCDSGSEVCDGIDNDCTLIDGWIPDADSNGIPDLLEPDALHRPTGTVPALEADGDGDGVPACVGGEILSASAQEYSSTFGCLPYDPALIVDRDCDDACALTFPGATPVCDGVVNGCTGVNGLSDEVDRDDDLHLACGPGTESDADTEFEYVLVWTGGDVTIPLAPPVMAGIRDATCGSLEMDSADGRTLFADVCSTLAKPEDHEPAPGQGWLCDMSPDDFADSAIRLCADDPGSCEVMELQFTSGNDESLVQTITDGGTYRLALAPNPSSIDLDDPITAPYEKIEPPPNWGLGACIGSENVGGCRKAVCATSLRTRSLWPDWRLAEARRVVSMWHGCAPIPGSPLCRAIAEHGELPQQLDDLCPLGIDFDPTFCLGAAGDDDDSAEGDDVSIDPLELSEFRLRHVPRGEYLHGCWTTGGETSESAPRQDLDEAVGGDCAEGSGSLHRDRHEGPDDALALGLFYSGEMLPDFLLRDRDELLDCAQCNDGHDNDCDSLVDGQDPACERCLRGGCTSGCGVQERPGHGRPIGLALSLLAGLLVLRSRGRARSGAGR